MKQMSLEFGRRGEGFEAAGHSRGASSWSAREFMRLLGYDDWRHFHDAVNKAIGTCMTLEIPVAENFEQVASPRPDGTSEIDYRLSRFACYLISMNGDTGKPGVAKAQAYLASAAQALEKEAQTRENVERVLIRDEISDHERGLSGAARAAGVMDYSFFQNAGYRGMYNMDLAKLKDMKGLKDKSRTLLDFMGKRELVGNLFRIVETEAKLKQQKTRGQNPAEDVAQRVGERVRSMMIENTGTSPEFLRLQPDVVKVRSGLKAAAREMGSLDRPAPKKRRRLPPHP